MTAGNGLDWPGLMQAGLRGLGLRPWEFWQLTPAELMLMLGRDPAAQKTFSRETLETLLRRFPDAPAHKDTGESDDVNQRSGGATGAA